MNKRDKVLILVPNLELGGQERVAARTADLLGKYYDVSIVVFSNKNQSYPTESEIVNLEIPFSHNIVSKVINVLNRTKRVKKIRKDNNIIAVYSFGKTANIVNVLSRGIGKTIIGIRGYSSVDKHTVYEKYFYSKSDAVVCCSQIIREKICDKYPSMSNKITSIYNPINLGKILSDGKEEVADFDFTNNTIVSHGRLEPVKNWPRLIKAFYLVKKQIKDAKLLIIGEGSQRGELETLISEYDLESSVKLLGFRKNPFKYLSRSKLYVLSSFNEGFPNSLLEGMVFLPSVATDCLTGPREILSDDNSLNRVDKYEITDYGILVKPATNQNNNSKITQDDEILAEAILHILSDGNLAEKLRLSANRRIQFFSEKNYIDNIKKIIES